jgi:hypothetical protein
VFTYTTLPVSYDPQTGLAFKPVWIWIDKEPSTYNEYIRIAWYVNGETFPVYFVRDGQVITPTKLYIFYREALVIPRLIYLPIVAKDAK